MMITVCLPALSAMANEQPIGRLFSSQRDRAALDQARQTGSKNRIDTNVPLNDQIGDQVTLDGFVRKNNGKTTVWINQVPQHGRENSQGITILQSSHRSSVVSIQLPSGKSIDLKPGQTFDATNGKVNDVYSDQLKPANKESAK
ncbi:MAG: hypothetical protein ACXWJF_12990 [Burkholderiaceae bacterium]